MATPMIRRVVATSEMMMTVGEQGVIGVLCMIGSFDEQRSQRVLLLADCGELWMLVVGMAGSPPAEPACL